MTNVRVLLPSSSELFERALSAGMSDSLPIPFSVALDPYTAPVETLPWLAGHYSVDLWLDEWPEARKREAIAQAAGRSTLFPGVELAALKTTRAAAARFLWLVDTTIVHKVSHPARYPVGKIAIGLTPINHPPFVARYLLKLDLPARAHAFCVGRSALGRAAIRTLNRRPLENAKRALTISKDPATDYSVTFAHRVPRALSDGYDIGAGHVLGAFKDRIRL